MGEYNDTIREQKEFVGRLVSLTRIYQYAICRGISLVNVSNLDSFEQKENLRAFYHDWAENYVQELNCLKITGKGEIYYKDELYHTKDAIASIIKQHLEILERILSGIFGECEEIIQLHHSYAEFLKEFVKYRRVH